MKRMLLTYALALFAVVGISAQEWCRTLATDLPGQEITHDVNGFSVTQYRAETALIQNAGATGVRYTVVNTNNTNMPYGGGPFFAMGEMIVLDAAGDTINYTVTSNADHNTMSGWGTDGAGLPALNDGNLNNFFHSSWGGTEPGGLHYLELTFEAPVDAFQLVWYTRPNQHINRPTVVGLTNPGVDFTEDMLFAEYEFEAGEQVTDASEFENGGTFTLYVDGDEDLSSYGYYTGNGSTYIALSGYTTGSYSEPTVTNLVQFIPASNGKFVLYQPVLDTYYANPDHWTDGYNGQNGWLRAYSEGWTLAEFEITQRPDGDFEITTELKRQYIDGAWVNYDEPLKVWVGYDMRGNLKIFPENDKEGLEQGDYTLGFGLPVDFGFTIYNASVNKEMVPDKTATEMCSEVLEDIIKVAAEKKEEYLEYVEDYAWYDEDEALDVAVDAAQAAVEAGDLAASFSAKTDLENALAGYVAILANYYEELHGELSTEVEENMATPPYTQDMTGMYTSATQKLLDDILGKTNDVINSYNSADGTYSLSYSQIEALYAEIESLLEQIGGTKLAFSSFPEVVDDIPADNFPYSELPNNAVWKKNLVLTQAAKGIRLTFLDRHIGNSGDGGNFPMIAIGELKIYDADGNEVTMAAENFYANHTETNEGFESTVARLCDGNFAAQGYYHSPWSGAEPQEYIYIDITFPEAMDNFTFEVYSRDKSTTIGKVSLFPKKVAITNVGEAYDPLLYTNNPYNVYVGEKVVDATNLKDGGLYVIKGLYNTQAVKVTDEYGYIYTSTPEGKGMFYHGTERFNENAAAVRADGVYRFVKNDDGTFKLLNLGLAKYWPSTTNTGFVSGTTTYEAEQAANINIVASTNVEGAFVMYEYVEGLTTENTSYEDDTTVYDTPYIMFLDWSGGLATRPVVDPQPVKTSGELPDNWGDAQCFNKANGEGEWEIYEVTMDNPDFYYLTNLVGVFDKLGLVEGTNPGEVSNLGNLEGVLAEGQRVVADSAYAEAPAAAAALAKEIATVNNLEKNPMIEGRFRIISANPDFKDKQQVEKALYATVDEDGNQTFGWKSYVQGDPAFHFIFKKSEDAEDLVAVGAISEEDADKVYKIQVVDAHEGETPYYVGETDMQSTLIDLFSDWGSNYLVLNATGSAFTLQLAGRDSGFSIHANQHGGGTGQSGNIVYWNGSAGASQWYLEAVDDTEIEPEPDAELLKLRADLLNLTDEYSKLLDGFEGEWISSRMAHINEIREKIDEYTKDQLSSEYSDFLMDMDIFMTYGGGTTISAEKTSLNMAKRTCTLSFKMANQITNFTAFQCNITLPAGFSIAKNEDGDYDVTLNRARVASSHTIATEKQSDGSYLIACYSSNNALIKGTNGELFYINVEADESVVPGNYRITGRNLILSTPEGKEMNGVFNDCYINLIMPADVNKDNYVDSNDLYETVNGMFEGEEWVWENYLSKEAADMNQNGEISIIDVAAIADVAMNGYTERELNSMPADGSIMFGFGNDKLESGKTNYFPLTLIGNKEVVAIQCDLYVSGDINLDYIEPTYETSHMFEEREMSDGGRRVIIYSESNEPISRDFVTIAISMASSSRLTPKIEIRNLKVCTTDFEEYWFNDIDVPVKTYNPGDTNGDSIITISDVVLTVNALLGNIQSNFVFDAADMNGDGEITISDVVSVVNALLSAQNTAPAGAFRIGSNAPMNRSLSALHVSNAIVNGNEATMAVKLDNADRYTAMQFDMALPEGVSIKEITMNGKHTVSHNGSRVVAYSLTNRAFDNDEDIMTITLNVENAVENATVTFDNIIVGTPEFAEKRLNAVSARIEGTTGIADNGYEATGIYTENGRIVIEATSDGVAEIVTADGIVRKVEITAGKNHIAVGQKGMFVVKVGNKIAKVVL